MSKDKTSHEQRYINASNKGVFSYQTELNILEHILNKLNPISKTEYAKKEGISIAGVNDRMKRGKIMHVQMINRTFIL